MKTKVLLFTRLANIKKDIFCFPKNNSIFYAFKKRNILTSTIYNHSFNVTNIDALKVKNVKKEKKNKKNNEREKEREREREREKEKEDDMDVYLLNGRVQHIPKNKKENFRYRISDLPQKKKVSEQIGGDTYEGGNGRNYNNININKNQEKYERHSKKQFVKENNISINNKSKEKKNIYISSNKEETIINDKHRGYVDNTIIKVQEKKNGEGTNPLSNQNEQTQTEESDRYKKNNESSNYNEKYYNTNNNSYKKSTLSRNQSIKPTYELNEQMIHVLEKQQPQQQTNENGNKNENGNENNTLIPNVLNEMNNEKEKEEQKKHPIEQITIEMKKEKTEKEKKVTKIEENKKPTVLPEKDKTKKQINYFNESTQQRNEETVPPPKKDKSQQVKTDIYAVLNEINSKEDKQEIEKFLNYLLLYKNEDSGKILGNAISFYFCNMLSDDLKDLKTYYRDGTKLSVNAFFSTINEMDHSQLVKMTNIYLSDYFSKIFKILKSNNIHLSFDNIEINTIKLLEIYNVLGLIRNEGKRKKQGSIKKFLYQYICVENKHMELLKNNNKMKFLTSIIQNGAIVRMHLIINVSYNLSSFNTLTSSVLTETKIKNIDLEFIFENELTNPYFSLHSNETVNLKSSGWYLVDVNKMLNGNLPYEQNVFIFCCRKVWQKTILLRCSIATIFIM